MARPTKLTPELQADLTRYLLFGCYLETAAAMVGIDAETLRVWGVRGAREIARRRKHEEALKGEREKDKGRVRKIRSEERQRRAKRQLDHSNKTRSEQRYVAFHGDIERALAQAELGDLATIAASAKGGHVIERRTVKDLKTGEETTVEKRSKPEWQAAAWKLERRNPGRWSRTTRLEVAGDEDKPSNITLADAVKAAYHRRREKEVRSGPDHLALPPGRVNGSVPNGRANGHLLGDAEVVIDAEE